MSVVSALHKIADALGMAHLHDEIDGQENKPQVSNQDGEGEENATA